QISRERRGHMVGGVIGTRDESVGVGPVVMKDQRCPVVDQVWLTMPDQHVGVAPGPVHIAGERIQPQYVSGQGRGDLEAEWIEAQGTGQKVHPQVDATTGSEQLLDLWVGLPSADVRVELHLGQLMIRKPQRSAEFSSDDLGN